MSRTLKCAAGMCMALALPLFAAGPAPLDACSLLPETVIARVQGSEPTRVQPSGHDDGSLTSSECFFTLAPFSKSVSLQVLSHSAGDRLEVREFWNQRFHKHAEHKDAEAKETAEDEKDSPPKPVQGLGEEAYWLQSARGGALYVLQGRYLVRVSIGGNGTAAQQQSSVALARTVLQALMNRRR